MTNELLNAICSLIAWAKKADKTIYDEWGGPGEEYVQDEEITDVERLVYEKTRIAVIVLTNMRESSIIGATRTHCGDVTRITFDRPIHVEQGEDLEIEEVFDGDQ